MSENWGREDMVRMLGSERAADFAREMAALIAALEREKDSAEVARDALADFIEWRIPGSEVFRATGTVVT